MITSSSPFRWSTLGIILLTTVMSGFPAVSAAENRLRSNGKRKHSKSRSVSRQIVTRDASAVSAPRPRRRSRSMVAQAASGNLANQIPESPLDGSLVRNQVAQVGFFDGCPNGCGSVCDCDGISYSDPGCGVEVSCGVEPGCGFEPGCGIGHALEMMGPACGAEVCGCGDIGCDGCGEAVCGAEAFLVEPGCGLENSVCCGTVDCGCDACGGCDIDRIPFFLPLLRMQWCRFDFFAGVQGFKGPMNYASSGGTGAAVRSGSGGSFGFYEGFNEGRSLKRWLGWDMSSQLGVRATQNNLSGSDLTQETRQQIFVTAGLFRRVDYGLQYGTVVDYLNDDWWFQGDLTQARSELSWKTQGCHVFGLQTMFSLGDNSSTTAVRQVDGSTFQGNVTLEGTDQYRLFYRRLLNRGGDWTGFAGWTDNDDTLLGASMNMPLQRKLLLATSATYLIPREDAAIAGHQEEGWNLSMGLVYRPGGPKGCGRYCRPLFDVADNGTFMVDQK